MEEPEESASEAGQETLEKESGDERLAYFIGLLTDDDETTRWKAAEVLGRMGDPPQWLHLSIPCGTTIPT